MRVKKDKKLIFLMNILVVFYITAYSLFYYVTKDTIIFDVDTQRALSLGVFVSFVPVFIFVKRIFR